MAFYPVAGMKIYMGGVKSDQAAPFVASDFDSQVWTEIDGWETFGALGDSVADIGNILINRDRAVHQKGAAEPPPMTNNFIYLPTDAGQLALIAAGNPAVKDNYAFRIKGNETGTPSERYFIALVMGTPEQGGKANTTQMITANLQINSNIVRVAAS